MTSSPHIHFRKRPVVIEAMQLPDDDRPAYDAGGDNDEFHEIGRAMTAQVRAIAVWMTSRGYDANPDDEDRSRWGPNSFHEGTPLPEYGINYLEIETPDGTMSAQPGDWIVRDVTGEFYICKDSTFAETYERAEAPRG